MSEYELHLQIAKFLNHGLDGNTVWFHIGNGGYRRQTEAKRLKAMGVLAGIPDIAVINDGRAIFLELKAPKGRLSEHQQWCHEQLRRARCPVIVCRSVDEVEAALRAAGVPLRTTLEPAVIRGMRAAEALVTKGRP